jgi:methylenetetrahydrofolate dehydrogenase (NADP+)/methenyltetrahydrofolate cyclohydrolase
MITVDGNQIAKNIINELKKRRKKINRNIGLAVVQVGQDKISSLFIGKKRKIAESLDINFSLFRFDEKISGSELRQALKKIVQDSRYQGILVQLPLPKTINTQRVLDAIPPEKDVDVLSSASLGKFYTAKNLIYPPIIAATLHILEQYDIKVGTKTVVLVGGGRLVGKPLAVELIKRKATVIVINSSTVSPEKLVMLGDVVISAAGKAGVITEDMVKKGAAIIDAGLSIDKANGEKGIFRGDVILERQESNKKINLFVPATGGLGPITVVMVMKNLLELSESNKQ